MAVRLSRKFVHDMFFVGKLNSQHKALLKKYENFDSYHSESVNKTDGHDDYEFSPPPSPICMEDDTSEANFEEVSFDDWIYDILL